MYTLSQHIKHRLLFIRLALLGFLMLIATAAMAQGGGSTPHVTIGGSVFGGGNLAEVGRNSTVTIDQANATMTDVYGGGALANVGTSADDTTTVNILQGHISGNVYGGGLGDSTATGYDGNANVAALVHGKVFVNIGAAPVAPNTTPTGNAIINGSVFGCNNINGTPLDSVFVNIYKTAHTTGNTYPTAPSGGWTAATLEANYATPQEYALIAVYGGGNKASYKPSVANRATTVHIFYCSENTIETAYGGGNAADVGTPSKHANTRLIIDGGCYDHIFGGGNGFSATGNHNNASAPNYNPGANIYGTATTEIHAGLFKQVFGGSNQYGSINTVNLNIDKDPNCDQMILESFCGGNEADMVGTDINTTILCSDINIGTLYGGSNKAHILKDSNDNGGNVTLTVLGGNYDYVFGGSKGVAGSPANIAGNVTLNLHGGTIHEAAFGGSDVNGNILGSITVNVLDTVHGCPLTVDTIYGGGRDAAYTPTNANSVSPAVYIQHCTVESVFGAGKGSTATVTANPQVIIGETNTINGSNGQPLSTAATVNGDVYGGGDAANVNGTTTVIVQKCNSSAKYVYGGGNAADVNGTQVYIRGGEIDTIFGGGHGNNDPNHLAIANVNGNDTIAISGGKVGKAFAGSNLNGTISGRMSLTVAKSDPATCDLMVGEVYGGGNMAAGKAGTITIGCTGDWTTTGANNHTNHNATNNRIGYELEGIGTVYGGANQADIGSSANHSNIVLNIKEGIVENVYGGNNTSGDIYGTIQVNIDNIGTCGANNWYVGNVFGGGNLAAYTGNPEVNILNGTVSGNVYGGGNGELVDGAQHGVKGKVTGAPQVTIGDSTQLANNTIQAVVLGEVYGGGNAADVTGTPVVTVVEKCNTQVGEVYGGGNAANVGGANVTVRGGTINATYGGGHGDKNASNPDKYADVNGNVTLNVNGGTIGKVFAGSNSRGSITGSSTLTVNKTYCDMFIGEVYGGGNEAAGNAGTINILCTGDLEPLGPGERYGYEQEGIFAVYGGANQAQVGTEDNHSDITLNIHSGIVENVFGGNNTNGTIYGDITVNINKDNNPLCSNEWYVGNVFGGGNLAAYSGNPEVNILNGTVSGNVYGGGNGDLDDNNQMAGSTGAPTVTIGDPNNLANNAIQAIVLGDVYGGGNAAKVTGNTAPTVQVLNKCNTEVGNVYGGGNAADVPATNVTIAGGTVHHDVFGGGHGDNTQGSEKSANVTGNSVVNVTGAKIDRVFAGSNLNGSIGGTVTLNINKSASASCDMMIGEVYGGGNQAESKAGAINIGCVGAWTTSHDSHNDSTNRIGYELEGIGTVYGGANAADVTSGNIALNINSGIVENVYGGNNANGSISGTIQVNINKEAETNACSWYVGNVFGGGNQAAYSQTPAVNIQAGTVSGSVYGGGNQAGVGGGNVTMTGGSVLGGSTVGGGIYGGCNTSGVVSGDILVTISDGIIGSQNKLNDSIVTNVFGGGYGSNTSTTGNVTVTVGSTSTTTPVIYGDVYGGSAMGSVNDAAADKTTVNIIGGVLKSKTDIIPITATDLSYVAYTGGNVYGGGLGDRASLGSDHSDVYAMVNGEVIVNIGTYTVDALDNDTTFLGYASIEGNVYGGNNTYGSPQDNVTVNIYGTNHTSGPSGNSAEEGSDYAIANVFGGGNEANYEPENGLVNTTKKARVNVKGCDNTIHRVFGGGNAAATPSVRTEIQGGRFYQVFGGGNGERGVAYGADINGDLNLFIHGGEVGQFYGASNQNGTISGTINVVVDNNGPCDGMIIDEFFCGGNYANINGNLVTDILCSDGMEVHNLYGGCNQANISGNVVLNVYGGVYTNVFGGSKGDLASLGSGHYDKAANIGGNVTLNLYGGTIENAFGGSNVNGNIGGVITVNVLDAEGECPLYLTNIYGGSNLTSYTPGTPGDPNITSPIVNVGHIKYGISGNVYGGSRGEPGTTTIVKANPQVNVGYESTLMSSYLPEDPDTHATINISTPRTIIAGNVFGGGDAAEVQGNTEIFLRDRAKVFGNVYGGGNLGEVTGDTKVIVNGANQ